MQYGVICFRTRGGPVQGWGNVFRLAGFAQHCMDKGWSQVRFFVEGPEEVTSYLSSEGFDVVTLPEDVSLKHEAEIISGFPKSDVMIMEMLDCTYERQTMLKRYCKRLVVFDDLLDHYYSADLVVCGQALPGYGNKDISDSHTRFALGFEYFMCRPQFLPYRTRKRHYEKDMRRVTVLIGGGKYDVGFLKAAHALAGLGEAILPTFVLGYGDTGRLKEQIQKVVSHAEILGGVRRIEELLWKADLAIVSAGYCKFEAAITGTPAVMMATQWHQIPLGEVFQEHAGMPYVGYMGFLGVDNLESHIRKFVSADSRKRLGERIHGAIDGRGMERVYDNIMHCLEES